MGSLANKDFSMSTETMVWDLVWERPGWRGLYINGSTTSRWGLGRELWRPWLWGPERPVAPRQLGPWRFAATYCPPPPCPALSLHLPLHCWSVEASTEPALTLASMPRLSHVRTDLRVWSQRTRNTELSGDDTNCDKICFHLCPEDCVLLTNAQIWGDAFLKLVPRNSCGF